jgi:hypothetical protein
MALTAEDNKAGVAKIEYHFGGDTYAAYTGPLPVPPEPGNHRIRFRAEDKCGNMSDAAVMHFHVDGIPPTSKKEIKGPHFIQRQDAWITRDTFIHLTAADDASGLRDIYYRLDGGSATPAEDTDRGYRLYDGPVSIAEEGRFLFKFYSRDNVGNREADRTGILIVDNTPPVLVTTFSLPGKGDTTLADGSSLTVYPRYTSLFLGASDNASGIAAIRYRINKAKEEEYTRPIPFPDEGTFSIIIFIKDNVNNVTQETIKFIIED